MKHNLLNQERRAVCFRACQCWCSASILSYVTVCRRLTKYLLTYLLSVFFCLFCPLMPTGTVCAVHRQTVSGQPGKLIPRHTGLTTPIRREANSVRSQGVRPRAPGQTPPVTSTLLLMHPVKSPLDHMSSSDHKLLIDYHYQCTVTSVSNGWGGFDLEGF